MNMAAFYAKHKKTGFYLREKIIFSGSEKKRFCILLMKPTRSE